MRGKIVDLEAGNPVTLSRVSGRPLERRKEGWMRCDASMEGAVETMQRTVQPALKGSYNGRQIPECRRQPSNLCDLSSLHLLAVQITMLPPNGDPSAS